MNLNIPLPLQPSLLNKNIFIGMSGYSYPDWKGVFYPPSIKPESYLQFYSENFPYLEINYTYYKMPTAEILQKISANGNLKWISIKIHQSFTHTLLSEAELPRQVALFEEGLRPLSISGKLATILFQFPYSFHYTTENRKYLGSLLSLFKDYPLAVEFRSEEWIRESVIAELLSRGISLTSTDLPALKNLPPPILHTTSPIQYLRFHGRNEQNWWSGDNASRYDYCYSGEELIPWCKKVLAANNPSVKQFLTFNNHWKAQGVRNANEIADLLLRMIEAGGGVSA